MPNATPEGVPVIMTVPCSKLVPWLMKLMIFFTLNSKSFVFESCLDSPFTNIWIQKLPASPTSLGDTIIGPRGAYLSKPLPKHH